MARRPKRSSDYDEDEDLVGGIGHNSVTEATREKLRQTVARIERLEEEKKEVADQIKDVYAEAMAFGFDTKALRALVSERKKDPDKLEEFATVLDLYRNALGMI